MSIFTRAIYKFAEKIAGTFYEGPSTPERIFDQVVDFANAHPHATRAHWIVFAQEHASICYRSGYVRGIEYIDRDIEERKSLSSIDPDYVVAALNPAWGNPYRPAVVVDTSGEPEDLDLQEAEEIRALLKSVMKLGENGCRF